MNASWSCFPRQHGERAAVIHDEVDRWVEELRLRHELHLPPDVHGEKEVVEVREVVRRQDRGAVRRNVLCADRPRPEEERQGRRQHDPHRPVHVVWPARRAHAGGTCRRTRQGAGRCRPGASRGNPPYPAGLARLQRLPAARTFEGPSPTARAGPDARHHPSAARTALASRHIDADLVEGPGARRDRRPGRRRRARSSRPPREPRQACPGDRPGTASASELATAPPSARSSSRRSPDAPSIASTASRRLVRDRLERRARQVLPPGAARQADDRAARVRVPVRRPEAGQGWNEVDAIVRIERCRHRLSLVRRGDHAESVAQPLNCGSGDEDARLERVVVPCRRDPRRRS